MRGCLAAAATLVLGLGQLCLAARPASPPTPALAESGSRVDVTYRYCYRAPAWCCWNGRKIRAGCPDRGWGVSAGGCIATLRPQGMLRLLAPPRCCTATWACCKSCCRSGPWPVGGWRASPQRGHLPACIACIGSYGWLQADGSCESRRTPWPHGRLPLIAWQLPAIAACSDGAAARAQAAPVWYEGAASQEIVWAVSEDRGLTWGPHRTLVSPAFDLPVWAPVLHVQVCKPIARLWGKLVSHCQAFCLWTNVRECKRSWPRGALRGRAGQQDVSILLREPRAVLDQGRGRPDVVARRRHIHAELERLRGDMG